MLLGEAQRVLRGAAGVDRDHRLRDAGAVHLLQQRVRLEVPEELVARP